MGLPQLMITTFDHYAATYSRDKSGGANRYYNYTATVSCNFQTQNSTDNEQHKQRREADSGTVYFLDATAYGLIGIADELVIDQTNWRVMGKNNACQLGRLFSVNVEKDISDVVLCYRPAGGVSVGGSVNQ